VAGRVLGAVDTGEVPLHGLTPAWAVVIVNFEAGPLLTSCARSVLADTSAGAPELVVVDNDSHDDSVTQLEREFPAVRVVHAPGNVGYARAANLGIAATRAPVVAVVNADAELTVGTAAALLRRFDGDPRIGAVGPRIRNLDGTDYPSARSQPSLVDAVGHGVFGLFRPTNRFTRRYRQLDADPSQPRAVDWLSGAALWLRRDALDDVGGWDERYFMYMEDLDLCWRLRRRDWDVVYEPAGSVRHVQGASTARRPYRMLLEHHRSAWRFAQRRFTGWRRVLLPFTAGYLALRALLVLATHWARARSGGVTTSR
jgi:N-acetylglucosaminyl-diphospho-decaprenol L-rhamnosyltransferase